MLTGVAIVIGISGRLVSIIIGISLELVQLRRQRKKKKKKISHLAVSTTVVDGVWSIAVARATAGA